MTKEQFSTYTPRSHGTATIDEAISEIQREMDVRKRLFDRWVNEGRMSWVDANDRLRRHMTALKLLIAAAPALRDAFESQQPSTTTPLSFTSGVALDSAPTAVAA